MSATLYFSLLHYVKNSIKVNKSVIYLKFVKELRSHLSKYVYISLIEANYKKYIIDSRYTKSLVTMMHF